jgi:hypothetical protein
MKKRIGCEGNGYRLKKCEGCRLNDYPEELCKDFAMIHGIKIQYDIIT